jgi:serpin B
MKRVTIALCLVPFLALAATSAGPPLPGASTNMRTLTQDNNAFDFDLYQRLSAKDGNLFYSPYSISTALAMTSAGARGETAAQMAKVLHHSLDAKLLHPAFAELIREINGNGTPRDFQLHVAQSLWGDTSLTVRPDFQSLLQSNYGARLSQLDFQGQSEQARQQINRWVEERTNDKIKELLREGDISSTTRMVLVNAIYFKAAWQHQFLKAATQEDAEFQTASNKVKAAMMQQTEVFKYAEEAGLQALELPYKGGELSMVVLLPREKDGLAKLEQSLTPARLDSWLGKLASRRVKVALPRFKIEDRFDLGGLLSAMGMPLAFTPQADFSGMSTTEKLLISRVIHQAFVNVDEAGTEAAAATAVLMRLAGPPPLPAVDFRADHPFFFLIRHNHTGSILFQGRVANPSK